MIGLIGLGLFVAGCILAPFSPLGGEFTIKNLIVAILAFYGLVAMFLWAAGTHQ